jgi:hypothetical protein
MAVAAVHDAAHDSSARPSGVAFGVRFTSTVRCSQGGKSIEIDDACRERNASRPAAPKLTRPTRCDFFSRAASARWRGASPVDLAGRSGSGSSRDCAALLTSFSPHGTAGTASWLHNANRRSRHRVQWSRRERGISTWMLRDPGRLPCLGQESRWHVHGLLAERFGLKEVEPSNDQSDSC